MAGFSSVTLIQTGSLVRSVTSRSVASLAALKGVFALTMLAGVASISSTSYFGTTAVLTALQPRNVRSLLCCSDGRNISGLEPFEL